VPGDRYSAAVAHVRVPAAYNFAMRNEFLSDKRARFVAEYCLDQNGTQAAIRAGYAPASAYSAAHRLLKKDEIRAAVAERQALVAEELEVTRQEVMRGLLDAVEIARLQADPAALVKAWSELARMCGYYAPVKQQVDVSVSAKRMVDQFEVMSDAELLRLAEQGAPVAAEG